LAVGQIHQARGENTRAINREDDKMLKRFLLAVGLIVAVGSISARAQTKIVFGHQQVFDITPVLIAMDKGYFAKRNLQVTLSAIQLNSNNPLAVESGDVDIAMPTSSVLLQAIEGGLDHVAVSGFSVTEKDDSNFGIVVRPGSGIANPSDFVGKKVAVPGLNAFLHVLFREWLTMKGVDWTKVTFVESPFPQMDGVLKVGSADAAVVAQPFLARIVSLNDGTLLAYFIRDFDPGMSVIVFAAKRSWAQANPETIKAWRAAFDEGAAYTLANPDEARETAAKFLKLPPQAAAAIPIPHWSSALTEANLAPWPRIMKEQGMIKTDIPIEKVIFH
jgi:NitT/TauT family transport system substrate-binding protein